MGVWIPPKSDDVIYEQPLILAHCEDAAPAIGDRDAYRRWEIQDRRILDKEECLTYVFGLELVSLSNMPINHSVRKSLL